MKANFRKLHTPIEQAFHIRKDVMDYFDDAWHYHEMLELVYIEKGNGDRFIGDSIAPFKQGDVVLVGKKLPHLWKSVVKYNKQNEIAKCSCYVIQFSDSFLGEHFFKLAETNQIKDLFNKSERGIIFNGKIKETLSGKIKEMYDANGMSRLIHFLELLKIASEANNHQFLASPMFIETIYNNDDKINKVFGYIMDNFTNEITLEAAAEKVGMNKTAFCRYLKKRTKKTFSELLNEIRIGHACKLIQEQNMSISEAGYLSGYNSPSHFYKQFKLIKKTSPSEFKDRSLK